MRECVYCGEMKEDDEFTLEHVIPQFLGGAQAPDDLKTKDVCGRCNNNLGLFVDAGFEKDFLVFNELNESAYAFFDPDRPVGLPLRCMGESDLELPDMGAGEVCELWLGPLGEQVFWLRPKDERTYWYSGGNPRAVKSIKSRVYFMFSERSLKAPVVSWMAFRGAFAERKVKKVMCTPVQGADLSEIGFSEPDDIDSQRIDYLRENCGSGQEQHVRVSMYVRYDIRFMAKLALGMAYVLFGDSFRRSPYARLLFNALWRREVDGEAGMLGAGAFNEKNEYLKEHCGVDHGVTVTVLPVSEWIAVNLNLNRKMNWVVYCARKEDLPKDGLEALGEGFCVVMFKALQRGIRIGFPELALHNLGKKRNVLLDEIEGMACDRRDYFKNL